MDPCHVHSSSGKGLWENEYFQHLCGEVGFASLGRGLVKNKKVVQVLKKKDKSGTIAGRRQEPKKIFITTF